MPRPAVLSCLGIATLAAVATCPAPARSQLTLPDTVYAVVGRPMEIRYEQLIPQIPANAGLIYSCSSDSGIVGASGFTFTPLGAGSTTVSFLAEDAVNDTTFTATTHVKAVRAGEGIGQKSVLFVGNSLIAASVPGHPESPYVAADVLTAFLTDGGIGIRLLGTRGAAPGLHEGYPGWSWASFVGPSGGSNPFWDASASRLDFQKYTASTGQTGPIDFCVVQLGYNDIFGLYGSPLDSATLAVWAGRIDTFFAALLSADRGYPDCRIVLSIPSYGNIRQSAWLDDYGSMANWENYERNMGIYHEFLRDRYDLGAFHPNVTVCASGVFVNRATGYPENNYLHPNPDGYQSIADGLYPHLRALCTPGTGTTGVHDVPPSPGPSGMTAFPNPFRSLTTIHFGTPVAGRVRVGIYDVRGAWIATAVDAEFAAGEHAVPWDGRNALGGNLPRGVYFARLETPAGTDMVKLIR